MTMTIRICILALYIRKMAADSAQCYKPREVTESQAYFDHQNIYEQRVRAEQKAFFFAKYASNKKNILDFGGGAGFFLKLLPARAKLNIESNPAMRNFSEQHNRVPTTPSVNEVPSDWADYVISNMALEHTTNPTDTLIALRQKMRLGAELLVHIPNGGDRWVYHPGDKDHHLWAWDAQTFGNLLRLVASGCTMSNAKTTPIRPASSNVFSPNLPAPPKRTPNGKPTLRVTTLIQY